MQERVSFIQSIELANIVEVTQTKTSSLIILLLDNPILILNVRYLFYSNLIILLLLYQFYILNQQSSMGYSHYVCPTCQKNIITPSRTWHLAIVGIDHSLASSTFSNYLSLHLTRFWILLSFERTNISQGSSRYFQPIGWLFLFMPCFFRISTFSLHVHNNIIVFLIGSQTSCSIQRR